MITYVKMGHKLVSLPYIKLCIGIPDDDPRKD